MDPGNSNRSKKVVGLFLAAALTFTPGCSMNPFASRSQPPCTDANRDGYCDEDGRPVPDGNSNRYHRTSSWFPMRWGSSGSGGGTTSPSSTTHGVSSGSSGGIGSSARSGGGSSGGSSGG